VLNFNPDPEHPVRMAAGLMIQALPDCDLEMFDEMRNNMQLGDAGSVLESKDLPVEKKLWQLIEVVVGGRMSYVDIKEKYGVSYEFAESPVYKCSCSRDKMRAAVMLLEKDELREIFENEESPKVSCQFCKTDYTFTEDDFDLED